METIQMVTQLIGSLGFPIVACIALFWKIHEQDKTHKEEMEKFVEAINNNTSAITKLLEHMREK